MTLVYALQYDAGYDNMEISGLYKTLEGAQKAIPEAEWNKHETHALWEALNGKQYWCITVHALLD